MEQVITASELKYDARGLIPCVVQQYDTGEVLMVAWMNEESVGLTLKTGTTWFWSRSRQELWNKGATSGNMQEAQGALGRLRQRYTAGHASTRRGRRATPATGPASLKHSRKGGCARLGLGQPERIAPWECAPQTFRMEISERRSTGLAEAIRGRRDADRSRAIPRVCLPTTRRAAQEARRGGERGRDGLQGQRS